MEIFKNIKSALKKILYRDAITGKFVSKEYVKENPSTTVKEEVKSVRSFRTTIKEFFN